MVKSRNTLSISYNNISSIIPFKNDKFIFANGKNNTILIIDYTTVNKVYTIATITISYISLTSLKNGNVLVSYISNANQLSI